MLHGKKPQTGRAIIFAKIAKVFGALTKKFANVVKFVVVPGKDFFFFHVKLEALLYRLLFLEKKKILLFIYDEKFSPFKDEKRGKAINFEVIKSAYYASVICMLKK